MFVNKHCISLPNSKNLTNVHFNNDFKFEFNASHTSPPTTHFPTDKDCKLGEKAGDHTQSKPAVPDRALKPHTGNHTGPQQHQGDTGGTKYDKSVGGGSCQKLEFKLPHGTNVKVYCGDITKVNYVDVIVNAANQNLDHIGGVAYAISKAAGYSMQDECNR